MYSAELEFSLRVLRLVIVWQFWIYTAVSFFLKILSPLPVCAIKILSILQKKKKKD